MPGTVLEAHTSINCYPYTQIGLLNAADLAGLKGPISAGFSVWARGRNTRPTEAGSARPPNIHVLRYLPDGSLPTDDIIPNDVILPLANC